MTRRLRRALVLAILSAATIALVSLAILTGSGRIPGTQPVGTSVRLGIGAAIMGLATYKAFSGRLFATSWWNAIDEELSRRGFHPATTVEREHTAGIHVQLLSPSVVRMDRGGGIDHVMVGVVDGSEVRAFRARIRGGYHWIDTPAAALRLPLSLAPTTIRRVHRGVRPVGLKRAFFEFGAFNRAVDVRSADPYLASALVDARMIAWLSDHLHRAVIEVADGWAVAWSTSLLGATRSPQDLLDLLLRFSERIPRSVHSMFPLGPEEQEWVHPRPRRGVSALIDRLNDGPQDR